MTSIRSRKETSNGMLGTVAVLLLSCVVLTINRHVGAKRARQFFSSESLYTEMPPALVLSTQAVGPFRSLIINGLWWRAIQLQDQGDFFETIQLASWISTLQPRLAGVWTWQSWNLAWNISIQYTEPQEQFHWIMQALDLLRLKALKLNPYHPRICMEIARTFMEKIGKIPYNHYQWAKLMTLCLPHGSAQDIRDLLAETATQQSLETDPQVKPVIAAFRAAGRDPFNIIRFPENFLQLPPQLTAQITTPGFQRLRRYLAKRYLQQRHALKLEHMLEIDKRYGPLDWRLYHAQVIYWASPETWRKLPDYENYIYPYHRIALVEAVYNGRLLYIPANKPELITTSNSELVETVHEYLHEHADQIPHYSNIVHDFHRFIIVNFFITRQTDKAIEIFRKYTAHFLSDEQRRHLTFPRFLAESMPLVFKQTTGSTREGMITSLLYRAFIMAATNQRQEAMGLMQLARLLHRYYQRRLRRENARLLPDFATLWQDAYRGILRQKDLDEALKARIRRLIPQKAPNIPVNPLWDITSAPGTAAKDDHHEDEHHH